LWNRKPFTRDVEQRQRGGHVQRSELDNAVERCAHAVVDANRLAEQVAAVHEAMSDGVDLPGIREERVEW